MRITDKDKEQMKRDILRFLSKNFPDSKNMSEIARATGKSAPTVKKYVDELVKRGNLRLLDKTSMKLATYVRGGSK